MILDTSFIIDLMNGDDAAEAKLREIHGGPEQHFITSVTIFELHSGIARSKRPVLEKAKVSEILKGQLIAFLDESAAQKAGQIHGTLINSGRSIGVADCMIGGIALSRGAKVVTRNLSDFGRIPGLQIESY